MLDLPALPALPVWPVLQDAMDSPALRDLKVLKAHPVLRARVYRRVARPARQAFQAAMEPPAPEDLRDLLGPSVLQGRKDLLALMEVPARLVSLDRRESQELLDSLASFFTVINLTHSF